MALRPCLSCGTLTQGSRCPACQPRRRRTQAPTAARGYDASHKRERARWQPIVDAGRAWCHAAICLMPDRAIEPGTGWDLGHTPDRAAWTGPEHSKCNQADGARRKAQRFRR
jgi:hypothetical protein